MAATGAPPVLRAYGQHVDGLFTYCLSVLCEHDAAVAAVAEVRDLALRHGARLADPALRRAWLYALARHCCLRRLESGADAAFAGVPVREPAPTSGQRPAGASAPVGKLRAGRAATGARAAGGRSSGARSAGAVNTPRTTGAPGTTGTTGTAAAPGGIAPARAAGPAVLAQRREELARLAWPEAAGTGPEQREALELAVRHGLAAEEVAAVLAVPLPAAEELLETAAAEVGRTRAALLVLAAGGCPELAQLGGTGAEGRSGWVLGPALRRELVQHVVDCPTCRGTTERVAAGPQPGPADLAGTAGLPLLPAPVTVRVATTAAQVPGGAAGAAFLAGAAAGRRLAAAPVQGPAAIRFDQRGFPRHRAPSAGLALVRQRVVTTGVLAAVLTAPVVALWAAYRGGGENVGSASPVSSVRVDSPGLSPDAATTEQPNGGDAGTNGSSERNGGAQESLQLAGAQAAETLLPVVEGAAVPVPSHGSHALAAAEVVPVPPVQPARPGQLTVEASEWGNRTVVTLTNSGGTALHWHAVVEVDWLRLSRDEGTLEPGQRVTVTVTVDEDRAPAGHWTAKIALPPSRAVVTLEGGPVQRGGGPDGPSDSGSPAPGTPTGTSGGTPTGTSTGTSGAGSGGTGSGGGPSGPGGSRGPEPSSTGSASSAGSTGGTGGGGSGGASAPAGDGSAPSAGGSGPAHGSDPAPGRDSAPPPHSGGATTP